MSRAIQPSAIGLPRLIAELRAWGIMYLTGAASDAGDAARERMAVADLLTALAGQRDPRVRDAAIALLLLHPDLASAATQAVERARGGGRAALAEQMITHALAALYLQRMWAWQLGLVLPGRQPMAEVPFGAYWRARHLPSPNRDFGEPGLRALAAYERERTGSGANFAGDWLNQVDHLLRQEWARRSFAVAVPGPQTIPPLSLEVAGPGTEGWEAGEMSFRPDVSRDRIEQFLREFGQWVHHPGRVYLGGGAALVHADVRGVGATTVDIDLRLAVSDEQEAEAAVRSLITSLGINVELAYPGGCMPEPVGWEARSRYVGRYDALDVSYFDFVTSALAKIDRGTDRDLRDVELLAQQCLISRDELDAAMREILPQLGHSRFFNVDPQRFTQRYNAAVARLWGAAS